MIETNARASEVSAPAGRIWPALLPALFVAGITLAVGGASAYAPPSTGEMAVVFTPGTSDVRAFELVARAGGLVVGPSRFGNIVVAFAPDPGFAARVGQLGALLTLKATGICGPASTLGSVE